MCAIDSDVAHHCVIILILIFLKPDMWYKKKYTSGIKNNSKQHYHGQSSTPTYGCETELQKNAKWMFRVLK